MTNEKPARKTYSKRRVREYSKRVEREFIIRETEKFLASGGTITYCKPMRASTFVEKGDEDQAKQV